MRLAASTTRSRSPSACGRLAFANLLDGRLDEAVATIGELTDELMRRGALSNLRLLADVTAATAFRCGHPSWERLAATARALPITTLAAAHFELVPLPATSAEPLPRHEVVAFVRHVVAELRVGAACAGDAPTTAVAASPASITQLGDVCEFTYLGRTVAVRSTKGVADIVKLIRADGDEVHCLDLAGAAVDEPSTGETIDATARRQLRAADPRPPGRHRRGRGQLGLRACVPSPGRARPADRTSDGGDRPRQGAPGALAAPPNAPARP